MKKIQYIVTITFSVILAALCCCSLFADSDGFSSFENRQLAARPHFSAEEFFMGDFTDRYETYLLDNFMFRDFLIMGYQAYSNLLFLDAFSDDETIVASVDVDAFVTAGGQEGLEGDAFASGPVSPGSEPQTDDGSVLAAEGSGDKSAIQSVGQSDLDQNGQNGGPQASDSHTAAGEGQTDAGDDKADTGSQLQAGNNGINDGVAMQPEGRGPAGTAQEQGGEQTSTEGQMQGDGQTSVSGQALGDRQPSTAGQTQGDGQAAQQQSGQVTAAGTTVKEQADTKLNNSLIIYGDRIMMPTGSSANLELYGEIMSEFAQKMPELNVYSITGPTSAAFYASKKYSTGGYDQKKAESIIKGGADGVTIVKAYDKLMEHKDEYIYFRSDVHWSALGAYYAYDAFCESAGIQAADIETDFTKDSYEPFLGGLYSQIYKMPQAARLKNNPEQLDYYIPKLGHKVTLYTMGNRKSPKNVDSIINTNFKNLGTYKYACFAWGDQHLEEIRTDNPNGRKVLVLKDSYGSALIPFLVHNYSVVYVIDPKGFNNEGCLDFDVKTLIKEEKIDDVIFCFSIYGSARKIIRDSLTSLLLK